MEDTVWCALQNKLVMANIDFVNNSNWKVTHMRGVDLKRKTKNHTVGFTLQADFGAKRWLEVKYSHSKHLVNSEILFKDYYGTTEFKLIRDSLIEKEVLKMLDKLIEVAVKSQT